MFSIRGEGKDIDYGDFRRKLEEFEEFEAKDDRPTAEWLLVDAGFSPGSIYDDKLPILTKRGSQSPLQGLTPIERGIIIALRETEPYSASYGNFGTMMSDSIFGRPSSSVWIGEDGRIIYAPESEVTLALEGLVRKGWVSWEEDR